MIDDCYRFVQENRKRRRPNSEYNMRAKMDLFKLNDYTDKCWGLSYYMVKQKISDISHKWVCVKNLCSTVPYYFKQAFERMHKCKF